MDDATLPPKMLSTKQVCAVLGVHRVTVYALINSDELPATKIGPALRFWPADVALLLERNRVKPTPKS
jgi:excisionase family DNA binding protein